MAARPKRPSRCQTCEAEASVVRWSIGLGQRLTEMWLCEDCAAPLRTLLRAVEAPMPPTGPVVTMEHIARVRAYERRVGLS